VKMFKFNLILVWLILCSSLKVSKIMFTLSVCRDEEPHTGFKYSEV
jgi:hypothetical protein